MASSSISGRDPDGSQSKTENYFIRFRQFADAQISSLLQGIVGLPSAFSKNPSSNTRWAEIDDKLQRRDEANEHSKQSSNSGTEGAKDGKPTDKETEIPVKKYPGWQQCSSSSTNGGEESTNHEMDRMTKDLPLYSPVLTSLFAHLNETHDSPHHWIPEGFPTPFANASTSSPDQIPLNSMKSLQHVILSQLNAGSSLQSEYSLLPYLLFSPYSPLRLSSRPFSTTGDNFPYCDAFEDLIRVSQGRPMATTWTRVGLPYHWLLHHPIACAVSCMAWVRGMQWNGLLQEGIKPSELQRSKPSGLVERVANLPSFSKLQEKNTNEKSKSSPIASSKKSMDAQTEQDMYERFLRAASSPTGFGGTVESLFADIEKEFNAISPFTGLFPQAEKKFRDLKSSDSRLTFSSLFSDIEKDIKSLSSYEAHRAFEHLLSDTDKVLATALTPQGRQELKEIWSKKRESKTVSSSVNSGVEIRIEPDKVVSTSTTTEHINNEDGSVETSVTVWKRFADGRETMTSSTHTEDALHEGPHPNKEKQEAKNEEKMQKKKDKQGWFWK